MDSSGEFSPCVDLGKGRTLPCLDFGVLSLSESNVGAVLDAPSTLSACEFFEEFALEFLTGGLLTNSVAKPSPSSKRPLISLL